MEKTTLMCGSQVVLDSYSKCFQTIANQNLKATFPLEEAVAIFKRAL